jgi:hypothetical protein
MLDALLGFNCCLGSAGAGEGRVRGGQGRPQIHGLPISCPEATRGGKVTAYETQVKTEPQ